MLNVLKRGIVAAFALSCAAQGASADTLFTNWSAFENNLVDIVKVNKGGLVAYAAYVLAGDQLASTSGLGERLPLLTAVLIVLAGLYQFTPLKRACLKHCQGPLEYLTMHWRDGKLGAVRMGAGHGAYCLGCCWPLMLLLFVAGVMNILWIAALAVFVLGEKLLPRGEWVGRVGGVVFLGWGLQVLLTR